MLEKADLVKSMFATKRPRRLSIVGIDTLPADRTYGLVQRRGGLGGGGGTEDTCAAHGGEGGDVRLWTKKKVEA